MDLGDKRRNKRAIQMLEGFSAMPTASIPKACGDWADTMGAYRFFENDAFEWADILQPHIQSSMGRMAAHPVVLCIQDAAELDFNCQQAQGLGPLSPRARWSNRYGRPCNCETVRAALSVSVASWHAKRHRPRGTQPLSGGGC